MMREYRVTGTLFSFLLAVLNISYHNRLMNPNNIYLEADAEIADLIREMIIDEQQSLNDIKMELDIKG
jgi:hypothetical protein